MMRPVAITGYACYTARGGPSGFPPATDLAALPFAEQISSRADLRAQGHSQQLASYCAGQALDMAGLKGDVARLADMDLMIATPAGERDEEIDEQILRTLLAEGDKGELNTMLLNLRPSLFLAQLQNLFAANISIVFGVLGTSITFMGETLAGAHAIAEARARIASGRSAMVLTGGVFNGARRDIRSFYEMNAGAARQGVTSDDLGSGCGFLVLEDAAHAHDRGAPVLACLGQIAFGDVSAGLPAPLHQNIDASGATVFADLAEAALKGMADGPGGHAPGGRSSFVPVSAATGHLMEAAMPIGIALATQALVERHGPSRIVVHAAGEDPIGAWAEVA